jgi:hypothetical protein
VRLAPSGRVLAAVVVVGAAGGIGAAVSGTPTAKPANPVAHRLPLSIGTPDLTCPGPETLLVPDGARAIRPDGDTSIAVMAADASGTATAGTRLRVRPLAEAAAGDVSAPAGDLTGGLSVRVGSGGIVGGLLRASGPGAAVVESPTTGAAVPPLLAGVQSTLATGGDLRGLATTTCAAAAADTWLVGGATTTGQRLRLLLANPAETPATVDVTVHGPDGRVRAPAGDGVDVPAGGSKAVFVDALAPDLPAVAVHVSARAGRVQATLHSSVLRGLVPGGTDDVPPAAPPARRQVVPGIAFVPAAGVPTGTGGEGSAEGTGGSGGTGETDPVDDRNVVAGVPGTTAVRVAVPGAEEGVVRIRLLGPEGEVELDRPAAVNVPAGGVVDVPVTSVPTAVYAAVVTADVPVVAGAVVGRATPGGPAEFGWAAATRPLAGGRLLTTVPGTKTYLALVAPGRSGQVRVREVFPRGWLGEVQVLGVRGGRSLVLAAHPDAVGLLVLEVGGGPVDAALVQAVERADGVLLSVRPVLAPAATSRPRARAIRDDTLGLPAKGRQAAQSSRP